VVTGKFADKPNHGQSSRRLVNSRTSQVTEMFDLKFTVYNCYKLRFVINYTIEHFQSSTGLGLVLGFRLVYKLLQLVVDRM